MTALPITAENADRRGAPRNAQLQTLLALRTKATAVSASFRALAASSAVIFFSAAAQSQVPVHLTRFVQKSGTHESLLAVSAFSAKVAWAAGTHGTVAHTTNGGETWKTQQIAGAESVDFHDVYAINDKQAFVMSVGQGKQSRIYRTLDGGAHWIPVYTSIDPQLVWRCFGFWDGGHGIGISDVQKGDFLMMFTRDGGETWDRVPADSFPAPIAEEQPFASNPACVHMKGGGHAWFATSMGRVIRTSNFGVSWKASFVHIAIGSASTVHALLFLDPQHGVLFAETPDAPGKTIIAETSDGGASWKQRKPVDLSTPVTSVALVPELNGPTLIVVGPRGATHSRDNGVTWEMIDEVNYRAVSFAGRGAGWAVGADGVIVKITF